MDHIWFAFTLLGVASGTALIVALLLIGRFSPARTPSLLPVAIALLIMALSALTGVYLRILDIPRWTLGYRLFNAAAWGYAAGASIYFLRLRRFTAGSARILGAAAGLLITVLLTAAGPHTPPSVAANLPEWLPRASSFLVGILIVFLAGWVGIVLLRRSKDTAVKPWQVLQKGLGITLLVLPLAELADLTVVAVAARFGLELKDGFLFAAGYTGANIILLTAATASLRISSRGPAAGNSPALARAFGLTRREMEIAEMVAEGLGDRQIAERLYISPRTIDTHLRNIYRKCDIKSRLQLLRLVHGYGDLRSSEE